MSNLGRGRYRWRTRLRRHLPWFLIDRGVAAKYTADCGDHEWYNADGVVEHCYHCMVDSPTTRRISTRRADLRRRAPARAVRSVVRVRFRCGHVRGVER